jgi:suppressor of ftsI
MVVPADTGYWGPVDREQILMLDDFYLDPDRKTNPFSKEGPDRSLMGRFGNLYLINGDTSFAMTVKRKERVRFLATNSCNTRVINLEFRDPAGAVSKIKIVGSDNGPYEWFDTAGSTTVAPSERKIFETYFEKAGTYRLVNHMLKGQYTVDSSEALGLVTVLEDSVATGYGDGFLGMEGSAAAKKSMDSVRSFADPSVPFTEELLLTGTMRMSLQKQSAQPEPISIEAKGIEWYDHMSLMNEISGPHNTTWVIRDLRTGKENHGIYWSFAAGSKIKIRIRNDTAAVHPMPHPIHFHGQRFLIAAVNGRRNLNLAWKDTYLVGTRETVDILLDAWNPGEWMAHCHIAEHHETMMMFHFKVE